MVKILLLIFGIAAVSMLLYLFFFLRPARRGIPEELKRPYAPRGLHGNGIPENSLPAFAAAVEEGYAIELDIQISRDGQVMVFHDASLLRMTGCDRKLQELTLAELKALYLAETEEKIPTLAEVLELVAGRVPLLVEFKGADIRNGLCEAAAELLSGYEGPYCVESFNLLLLKKLRKCLPAARRGQLYSNFRREKREKQKKATPIDVLLSVLFFNFLAKPDFISLNRLDRGNLPLRIFFFLYPVPRFSWTTVGEKETEEAKRYGEYPIFEKG
ncbi:MAG: glycerophosphodiester phosphodiesterase [Clostridia bacterium]|nr:glycerophosphodiester phosphodiesterase [Clostridia bacterium]